MNDREGSLKTTTIALRGVFSVLTAALAACGGGGSASDTTMPVLSSAKTDASGQNIVLTYNEALGATTAPASAFTALVNGSAVTVSSATVLGAAVTLKLASAVSPGQTILVSYKAPTADASPNNLAIQDSAGNDAAALTNQTVTNAVGGSSSSADVTTPAVSINGNLATLGSSGEYMAASGARITIADAQGRLGSFQVNTKDAAGNAVAATQSVYSFGSNKYDASITPAAGGVLTTITFSNFTPPFVVKIRWQ